MAVRKYKPITPGQRNKVISTFEEITTNKPHKALLEPLKRTGGRNNTGQMTVRYIGGGHKRMYRIIDFLRDKDECSAKVLTIENDPNRSARIALVEYQDGEKRYIIAPNGLKVGQVVASGKGVAPEVGNALPLSEIPVGTLVHNIELRPGQGAAMARSAGTFSACSKGRQPRSSPPAFRRDPYGARFLPRNRWNRIQPGSQPGVLRKGWPQPLAWPPSSQPWCCNEPSRPSYGRR